ncbi:sigma-70 family RNA polymerase sigma factor [Luedemannella helvata]|uniref:RNA polymerase sigma factor n=1 Tax=Luedemannella helvata TaxID=349315 RepID=A0ABP4X4U5_9ACTN
MEDTELVRLARNGDRAAFDTLLARHLAAARRTATLLGAGDDTDDVVQEACVKAYRRLGDYRGESPFRAWLLAIVANETRNLHRSRRRRDDMTARMAAVTGRGETVPDRPVDSALVAADRRLLVDAVRGLPEGERDVVVRRFLLDMSEAETAEDLGVPRGTVKSRASRGLAKLRLRLGAAVAVLAAVAVVIAVPPARRAVAGMVEDVLRFAGIEVDLRAAPVQLPPTPAPLPSAEPTDLAAARAAARFPIGVPAAWGVPERVEVADPGPDGSPRVVSLIYRGGAARVDQFDGVLDGAFAKSAPDAEWTDVGGNTAMWLPSRHPLTYVDRDLRRHTESARLAGPTLIWQVGMVTYRLEGVASLDEARAVAGSVR